MPWLGRAVACAVALLGALVRAEGAADRPQPFPEEEPVELYPCPALLRQGTMDESGAITRPITAGELGAGMARLCDYVVLGRFVRVSDAHYDELHEPSDQPVVSTFEVSEVLHGEPVATARIRLRRALLIAPGEAVSRYVSELRARKDAHYRRDLGAEAERELAALRGSGEPLTSSQHERLVEAVKRLAEAPSWTRYELHKAAEAGIFIEPPSLSFHSELGAIRPDEDYLLGLNGKGGRGEGRGAGRKCAAGPGEICLDAYHTYLFWGGEAHDIAGALRMRPR